MQKMRFESYSTVKVFWIMIDLTGFNDHFHFGELLLERTFDHYKQLCLIQHTSCDLHGQNGRFFFFFFINKCNLIYNVSNKVTTVKS